MLNDRHLKGGISRAIGAGTHTRMFWDDYQAGTIDAQEWQHLESRMTRAPGTCNTMGTASTMTGITESARPDTAGREFDSRWWRPRTRAWRPIVASASSR